MTKTRGGFKVSTEQAQVVDHVLGQEFTVVSAAAGSGKTYTMVATVLHLLEEKNDVNIDDFILITFTNKATNELKQRLVKAIEDKIQSTKGLEKQKWFAQKERLVNTFIGTIHGFCSLILKNFGYEEKIPHEKDVVVARRHFLEALDCALELGYDDNRTSLLFQQENLPLYKLRDYLDKLYHYLRNKGKEIPEVLGKVMGQEPKDDSQQLRLAIVYLLDMLEQEYDRIKKERGGVDTYDLLRMTVNLLPSIDKKAICWKGRQVTTTNEIVKFFAKRYRYMFIDEFQDTDLLQAEIVQNFVSSLDGVCVVGDVKQAIYDFRGAMHTLLKWMAQYNDVKMLSLTISHRPTKPLIEVQNKLFTKLSEANESYHFLADIVGLPSNPRIPQDRIVPFTYAPVGGYKDIVDRIDYAIKYVRRLTNGEHFIDHKEDGIRPIKPRDICFLFRTNKLMNEYAEIFQANLIDIEIDTGGEFFNKPEIINCFYMLHAILKYPNDLALDLAMRTPFLPFHPGLPLISGYDLISDWLADTEEVASWYEGMMKIKKDAKIDLVPKLLTQLFEFTRVREFYASKGNYQAVANLEKLVSWAREQMHTEALTLQQFVDRLQIAILTDEKLDEADVEIENDGDKIVFSTIHSAKGLEYPIVIIPEIHRPLYNEPRQPKFIYDEEWGLDLILPNSQGSSRYFKKFIDQKRGDTLSEEIRIFYVAITRAENAICLISDNRVRQNKFDSPKWSWSDEILRIRHELERLGRERVIFETPR